MATAQNKMQDANKTLVLALALAGEKTFYRVKHNGTMKKLMEVFAKRNRTDVSSIRFLVDGERVTDKCTPASLELEDKDQVDCFVEQVGGSGLLVVEKHADALVSQRAANEERPSQLSTTDVSRKLLSAICGLCYLEAFSLEGMLNGVDVRGYDMNANEHTRKLLESQQNGDTVTFSTESALRVYSVVSKYTERLPEYDTRVQMEHWFRKASLYLFSNPHIFMVRDVVKRPPAGLLANYLAEARKHASAKREWSNEGPGVGEDAVLLQDLELLLQHLERDCAHSDEKFHYYGRIFVAEDELLMHRLNNALHFWKLCTLAKDVKKRKAAAKRKADAYHRTSVGAPILTPKKLPKLTIRIPTGESDAAEEKVSGAAQ